MKKNRIFNGLVAIITMLVIFGTNVATAFAAADKTMTETSIQREISFDSSGSITNADQNPALADSEPEEINLSSDEGAIEKKEPTSTSVDIDNEAEVTIEQNIDTSIDAVKSKKDGTSDEVPETDLYGADAISRLQWWQMLISAFHLSVESDNYPDNYFADINDSVSYYRDVMVAAEYGLIDVEPGADVCANDPATREMAAHTLNYLVGYINSSDSYTFSESGAVSYPDDIQVAIDNEWFSLTGASFQPDQGISAAEFSKLQAIAVEAYDSIQIDSNHNNTFKLKEGVINLGEIDADITGENELTIFGTREERVSVGDAFVVLYNGDPFAFKAAGISYSGNDTVISYESIASTEVFDALDIETVHELDLADVDLENNNVELDVFYVVGGTPEEGFEDGEEYDSLEAVGDQEITAFKASGKIKDKKIGPEHVPLGSGHSVDFTLCFSNLKYEYSGNLIQSSASISGDMNLWLSADFLDNGGSEVGWGDLKKLLTFSIGVPMAGSFNVSPIIKITGNVHMELSQSFRLGISSKIFQAPRIIKSFNNKKFYICSTINVEIGIKAEYKINIFALKGGIFIELGIRGRIDAMTHGDTLCVDLKAYKYLEVGGYVSIDFGIWKDGWSDRLYIITEKNSPPVHFHYENGEQVAACSFWTEEEKNRYSINPNVRYGKFYTPINSRYGFGGSASGIDSNGEPFTLYETTKNESAKSAVITKYRGNTSMVIIPSEIDGYTVVGIGDKAFSQRNEITYISVPDTVTSIGELAFVSCSNLEGVRLSSTLTGIGYRAFANCTSLGYIEIPKTLKNVTGNLYAFDYDGPFAGCTSLETAVLAEGSKTVCAELFRGCTGLKSVTIPESVTSIEKRAFYGCTNLTKADIPSYVTSIGESAFSSCVSLKDVILPPRITSLGAVAFSGCTSITAINIPKSLTSVKESYVGGYSIQIGPYATAEGPLNNAGPFNNCSSLKTVTFETGITAIPNYLFAHCSGLENIIIPDTVTTVGKQAFDQCTNLESLTLSSSLKTINDAAFANLTSVKTITLPEGLTTIGEWVFGNCSGIESIVVPDTVTGMGQYDFVNCTSLKSVKLPNIRKNIMRAMFRGCTALESIELPETTTYIRESAFYGCEALKEIIVPKNTIEIEATAFYGCKALKKVTMAASVKTLGKSAFSACATLTNVDISTGLTAIPESAFSECDALTSITIPRGVTTIGKNAFADNYALTSISVPQTVTSIDPSAFSYPGRMTMYGIGGSYAESFANEQGMTFVSQDKPVTSISFVNETIVVSVGTTVPAGVTIQPVDYSETIEYKSDDESIFTVSPDGVITGVKVGESTLTVTSSGGVKAVASIRVIQPVSSVRFKTASNITLNEGDTLQLIAEASPAGADQSFKWTSSDPQIVSVDETGLVKALKEGKSVIRATSVDESKYAECTIEVKKKDSQEDDPSPIIDPEPDPDPVSDDEVTDLSNNPQDVAEAEQKTGTTTPTGLWIAGLEDSYDYVGFAIKPGIRVYDGEVLLRENRDYSVSWKNNTNAGTATIRINGKGIYTGHDEQTFVINKVDLSDNNPDITATVLSKGNKKSACVYWKGKKLTTKDYSEIVNANGTITITGKNKNFYGTRTIDNPVTELKPINKVKIQTVKEVTYTGYEQEILPEFPNGEALTKNVHYKTYYENNKSVGKATIIIVGVEENGYTGVIRKSFKIVPQTLTKDNIVVPTSATYQKGGAKPAPIVTFTSEGKTWTLREGVDYTVTYKNNTNANLVGKSNAAQLTVKGIGNFNGSVIANYTLTSQSISMMNGFAVDKQLAQNKKGKYYQSAPVIYDLDGKKLAQGKDYQIDGYYDADGYELSAQTGFNAPTTLTVVVRGKGAYASGEDTLEITYNVISDKPRNLASAQVKIPAQEYTGKAVKPEFSVGFKGISVPLKQDTDYEIVGYYNNIKKGTANVIISGNGVYSGCKSVTYKIISKKMLLY